MINVFYEQILNLRDFLMKKFFEKRPCITNSTDLSHISPLSKKNDFALYLKVKIVFKSLAVWNYIFSGADTPINFNAFANVVFTAVINARRASVSSLLSWLSTFSAL